MKVFITKVLIRYIHYVSHWRRDSHFTWSSEPREGSAACSTKRLPSFFSFFKTLSNGPGPGIEPATSRSAVMRSTDWANPACSVRDSKQCKISKYLNRNTPLQHWRVPAAWCSQIKDYTVVLSHPFRPRSYEEKFTRKRGSPSSWVNGKNSWPFARANSARTYSDCLVLTTLTQLDPARSVTLLAKPICFYPLNHKIKIWILICCPYPFLREVVERRW